MNLCTISAGCINVANDSIGIAVIEIKARVGSWRAAAQLVGGGQHLRNDMVCLLYSAFHLQQSRQITSRARSRCTRDQLASDSVCLIVASITHFRCESPEDFSILVLLQSTTTDHRTVAECTLDSPYSANKITMQSKHQSSRCSSRLRFIKDDLCLQQKYLGRPSTPSLFPGPLIPK